MAVLCLGEAIVDLICERQLASLAEADSFVPHFGGAVANVAMAAAGEGAEVALAGGAGQDAWGEWLRDRLAAGGVGLDWFELVEGCATPVAFVAIGAEGEATYQIYGDGIAATIAAVEGVLGQAVESSQALFFSSNTLVGEVEARLTMEARRVALELGLPVIFDPNLRLHRWQTAAAAAAAANACVPGALLVRANREEAALMTGEEDPEQAADALVKTGARLVVVTLGPEGAILRGEIRADAPGVPVDVRSTVGAGDVLTGVLLARLARSDFYPPAVAAALTNAVGASAASCRRWGAVD